MKNVRLISAGAGSGKTHRVVDELQNRLLAPREEDRIDPSAVLVTTFTREAAAELRDRLRRRLFQADEQLARRLDEALIGTTHSVCGELLRQFAFQAGHAAQTEVLDEDDAERAFQEALGSCLDPPTLSRLIEAEVRLGLKTAEAGRMEPRSSAQSWRKILQRIAEATRENGMSPDSLQAQAARSIEQLRSWLGAGGDGAALDAALEEELSAAVASFRALGDTPANTQNCLRELEAEAGRLNSPPLPWSSWVRLSRMDKVKKPAVAHEPLLAGVMAAASRYVDHPRLLSDLSGYLTTLFELAGRATGRFQEWKLQHRFVDFADQQSQVLKLLENREVVRQIRERIQLIVVDEFQDTNPLQLALFLKLSSLAEESIWVGDPKQAIYGFRGTDPSLMRAVIDRLPPAEERDILRTSYRSRQPLVDLVSDLFVPVFAEELEEQRVRLNPNRTEEDDRVLGPPLRHWLVTGATSAASAAYSMAKGIRGLLGLSDAPPVQIRDSETGEVRNAIPSDIAVLCAQWSRAELVADALEQMGIRAGVPRYGLMETPEASLVLAAMRRFVDPGDSLATATLVALASHDREPELWLRERLAFLQTGQSPGSWREGEPLVQVVDGLRALDAVLSPSEVLDRMLDGTDARRRVMAWGSHAIRQGNLEALRSLAEDYEASCKRLRSGATVAGLIHWMEAVRGTEMDANRQRAGLGPDAVTLMSIHGSKGREWPIVILGQLDRKDDFRLWDLRTHSPEGDLDIDAPLRGRWIRYWPWPFGAMQIADQVEARLDDHFPLQEQWRREFRGERARLLYVAMTRARDLLVVPAWAKKGSLRSSPEEWTREVLGPALELPQEAGTVDWSPGAGSSSLPVLTEILDAAKVEASPSGEVFGFPPHEAGEPRRPAALPATALLPPPAMDVRFLEPMTTGASLILRGDPRPDVFGTAVHLFLGADDRGAGESERRAMARRVLANHRLEPDCLEVDDLLRTSEALGRKLQELHGPVRQECVEWPVRIRVDGILVSGQIDLALDTDSGWVLVDHKTTRSNPAEWADRCRTYVPQLSVYALALIRATGRPLAAAYIHLPLGGALLPLELPDESGLVRWVQDSLSCSPAGI